MRLEREAAERTLQDVAERTARRTEMQYGAIAATISGLRDEQASMRRLLAELLAARAAHVAAMTSDDGASPVVAAADSTNPDLREVPVEELVALHEDINPLALLRRGADLRSLLEDERFNPDGRELTRAEKFALHTELVRGKARIDVLDAEIQAMITAGMEKLRKRGAYIEYAPGEQYESEPGLLTAAEEMPGGGLRMFYLYPEEFPELYEKRRERDEVAATSLRRVATTLRNGHLPGIAGVTTATSEL